MVFNEFDLSILMIEKITNHLKWNALYLECSHHCKFEIRIYNDDNMAYTVDMNRLSVCMHCRQS